MTLHELAECLHCRLEGDGDIDIVRVASLEAAQAGDLTFLSNPKYHAKVGQTRATAIIADGTLASAPCAILRSPHPYLTFARALVLLNPERRPAPGVHASAIVEEGASIDPEASVSAFAFVGAGATIGPRTVVHPFVYIGPGARIGADCLLYAHASIRERVVLGDRVIVQNGVVIGSDGYGFAPRPDGTFEKVPQNGDVIIEDDVEIGAGSAIARPPLGETRIGTGTKLDHLVHIAHGVHVGRHALLAGQVGIAGSTTIEDGVMLGGQVGVTGHVVVGKGTRATAQTGIPNDVAPGSFVSGYPAIGNRDWLKASAVFKKLPEMRKTLAELERRIAHLEGRRDDHS